MGNKNAKRQTNNSNNSKVLSEKDIQLLLDNTSFDRSQILDWYSGFLKDFPSGRINKRTFIKFYSKLYPKSKSKKYCKRVFKVYDTDNSGEIDFTELMMVVSATAMGDLDKKIELAFKIYDINKNGFIEKNEMIIVIEALFDLLNFDHSQRTGINSAEERVNSIMNRLDLDKDDLLTKQEFIYGCLIYRDICELLVPCA